MNRCKVFGNFDTHFGLLLIFALKNRYCYELLSIYCLLDAYRGIIHVYPLYHTYIHAPLEFTIIFFA